MFEWLAQSQEEFLAGYVDIGRSHQAARELQEDHKHFSMSSMVSSSIIYVTGTLERRV